MSMACGGVAATTVVASGDGLETPGCSGGVVVRRNDGPGGGLVTVEGWLRKRRRGYNPSSKQWNERYFVLRGPVLSYYTRRADERPRGEFLLTPSCTVGCITVDGKGDTLEEPQTLEHPEPPSLSTGSPHRRESKKGGGGKIHYTLKITWPAIPSSSSRIASVVNAAAANSANTLAAAHPSDDDDGSLASLPPPPLPSGTVSSAADHDPILQQRSALQSSSFDGKPATPRTVRRSLDEEENQPDRPSSPVAPPTVGRRAKVQGGTLSPSFPRPEVGAGTLLTHDSPTFHEQMTAALYAAAARGACQRHSSHRRTKKMLLQGSKVAVAAGAAVTATVLTAGVGLAAGLTFVAIGAAAGGSGAVASHTYFRSKKNSGSTLVLSSDRKDVITKWKGAIEAAIAKLRDDGGGDSSDEDGSEVTGGCGVDGRGRILQPSTWSNLFAMDGYNPDRALIPSSEVQGRWNVGCSDPSTGSGGAAKSPVTAKGADDATDKRENGSCPAKAGIRSHPSTRWKPVEGGWATLMGMGASGLRIYEEETSPPSPPERQTLVRGRSGFINRLKLNHMLSVKGGPCPPLKAQVILDATPVDAFMCLMSHARVGRRGGGADSDAAVGMVPASYQRASFRVVETIDDHSDIIHLVFRPLYLFPSWTAPRDYCLMRYWRLEDDGGYIVCYDSVKHRDCPPSPPYVRGEIHSLYTIAPLKKKKTGPHGPRRRWRMKRATAPQTQCLLTHTVQVDPRGWVPTAVKFPMLVNQGYAEAFAVSSLLQILDVRDALTNDRFVNVKLTEDNLPYDRWEKKRLMGSMRNSVSLVSPVGGESEEEEEDDELLLEEGEDEEGEERQLDIVRSSDSADETNDKVNYDFSYSAIEKAHTMEEDGDETSLFFDSSDSMSQMTMSKRKLMASVPEPLVKSMWAEPDSNSFMVRGKTYLRDKKKVHAGNSMLRLVALDIVEVSSLIMKSMCAHPKERVQRAMAREREFGPGQSDMPPFVFCMNITLPGPPHYHIVVYYAVDDISTIDGTDGSPSSLLSAEFFFGNSDEFRDRTFKLIPQIVDGNFIVRKAVGSTPAIMGTKLKQHYFSGERFFEIMLDVGSSSVAAGVVRLCVGYARTLVVDLAFLFEGHDEDRLPERLLGCCRLKNVDLTKYIRFVDQYD